MKQEKVSFRQLMALLWAGLLGPAAEWLPSMVTERAGPAGWLVPEAGQYNLSALYKKKKKRRPRYDSKDE